MIVRPTVIVAVASVLPLMASTAQAATLQEIHGVVLVDRGGGFDIVDGPTQLNPGDSVIVNPGGAAHVAYPDGCRVSVQPGAVVGVNKHSPCSKESASQEVAAEDQGGGFNTTNLLIGGAVVALGAGAAVLLIADDDETPASP